MKSLSFILAATMLCAVRSALADPGSVPILSGDDKVSAITLSRDGKVLSIEQDPTLPGVGVTVTVSKEIADKVDQLAATGKTLVDKLGIKFKAD